MPCLNESETLAVCIRKAKKCFNDNNIVGEVVIADNGSTDGSQDIAVSEGAVVANIKAKGYGSALWGGFQAAKGKYIIMGDSDDSYDFGDLLKFVEKLREGYDLVMGNRFKGGIKKGAMPFLHRYLGNPVLSFIGKLFFKIPVGDFHCGLRGFTKEAIMGMGLQTTGMEFASEIVVKASLLKMKMTEVPTVLSPDGRSGEPHLNTWNDGWRHLRFLLMYSPKWLFLFPGLFCMSIGVLLSAALMINPLEIFNTVFDVHTLLYSAGIILVGFQFVAFYFITKVFTTTAGLLPKSESFDNLFRFFNLEKGLYVGLILILLGVGLSIVAVQSWAQESFGDLEPTKMFRIIIPAVLSLILGVQTVLNSFFLSILGLKK
ncbi:MAG: dolichol-P-glucose synthetase [Flavobacteriales bacterium]|nr:MAG: dolichol-P-glucose synthetase [Flavobacteriales bacterium]